MSVIVLTGGVLQYGIFYNDLPTVFTTHTNIPAAASNGTRGCSRRFILRL